MQFRALVAASSPLPTTLNKLNAELTRFMRPSHERALQSVCGDKSSDSSFTRHTNLARIELRVQHVLTKALRSRAVGGRTALQTA